MRILLVQSFLGRKQHPVLPAGILSIAGALRGHDLMVADPNLHSSPMEYLRGILGSFRPDAVGISLRNCDTTSYTDRFSYLPAFARQVELIRNVLPGVHLVAGGAGFSLFAEDIMSAVPGIDCGVSGHGEALARRLFQDRLTGLHRGGSGMIAHPALDLVKMEDYLPFQRNLSLGVEVNRGCDRDCAYCAYGEISGKTVLMRNMADVAEEIEYMLDRGVSHLFLNAPLLNCTPQRGMEVVKALMKIRRSFSWEGYHTARGFSGEYAAAAFESGCSCVSFSPDGGNGRQMELQGKDYAPEDLERAVILASSAGIGVRINIFPWHPETGVRGMMEAFRNGRRWGSAAGDMLSGIRFSLVRRVPGGPRVHRKVFERPPAGAMTVFLVLSSLLGGKGPAWKH